MARPSIYTTELAQAICKRLAAGESLRAICRDDEMPDRETVHNWHINDVCGFSSQYAHAREIGLDEIADETMEIVDDGRNDWIEKENERTGKTFIALNDEAIARSRLRADNRWRYLSKLAPRKYGELVKNEITNPDGSLRNGMSEDQIAAKLDLIMRAAMRRKQEAEDDGSDLV